MKVVRLGQRVVGDVQVRRADSLRQAHEVPGRDHLVDEGEVAHALVHHALQHLDHVVQRVQAVGVAGGVEVHAEGALAPVAAARQQQRRHRPRRVVAAEVDGGEIRRAEGVDVLLVARRQAHDLLALAPGGAGDAARVAAALEQRLQRQLAVAGDDGVGGLGVPLHEVLHTLGEATAAEEDLQARLLAHPAPEHSADGQLLGEDHRHAQHLRLRLEHALDQRLQQVGQLTAGLPLRALLGQHLAEDLGEVQEGAAVQVVDVGALVEGFVVQAREGARGVQQRGGVGAHAPVHRVGQADLATLDALEQEAEEPDVQVDDGHPPLRHLALDVGLEHGDAQRRRGRHRHRREDEGEAALLRGRTSALSRRGAEGQRGFGGQAHRGWL